MFAKQPTSAKRRVSRAALAAQMAALCVVSSSALAAIVDSGAVSITIPNNIDGVYLNVVTGATGTAGGATAGWDINLYNSGSGLTFFWPSTPAASAGGVANATPLYLPQPEGSVVSVASTFSVASGGGGPAPFANFRVTGTNNLGIRFFNEATSVINYGYITLETTAATGFPATIRRIVYGNAGEAVTVTGLVTNTPPQFAYSPASGAAVPFTGGGLVGTTGTGSVVVTVGTAGVGTGAPATTTTTCTPPTAPFSGFGQSVTAVGPGTISGGPLSGTCVLGAAEVTQTLTCNESRGGAANARTFTLTCPAGTQPALVPTPASGSQITLPSQPLGGAATSATIGFQNPGSLAATVTCIQPAAPFSASPLSILVPAGGSASTTVSYSSGSVGTSSGTLNCSVGAQQFSFNLQGTTLLPAPAFIPTNNVWTLALMGMLMSLLAGVAVMRRQS